MRWTILTLPLTLVVGCLGGTSFFEPLAPPRPFQIMAQPGAAQSVPPYSQAALSRYGEDGVEWALVDLRTTQDGQLVLTDNPLIVERKPWLAEHHTLAECLALDLGAVYPKRFASERLLALTNALQLARSNLNLCLNGNHANPSALARAILDAKMESQVVVSGELAVAQGLWAATQGKVATLARWQPGLDLASWAGTNHLAAVEIDPSDASPAVVAACHALGLKVKMPLSGAGPETWDQAIASGADWLATEAPEELFAHALWRRITHRPVRVSCHRGANRYAPENTLPALEKSLRLGVDFMEFDIRATRDGQYYLLHDSQLGRTTGLRAALALTPSSTVKSLSAGWYWGGPFATTRLPSLDEFLREASGKIELYVDAKAIPPEALAEVLARFQAVERSVVYQGADYLEKLRTINPRIRALPPLEHPEELGQLKARVKPYGVDAAWNILSRDLIAACHAAGIVVFSDALDAHETVADYLQAMEWGIDVIQTDHPLRVMRAIELREARRKH